MRCATFSATRPITTAASSRSVSCSCFPPKPAMPGCSTPPTGSRQDWLETATASRSVYHCFDRIVIYGYLSGLSRPEQVVHFFRNVVGVVTVRKEVLSQRTADYQAWVDAYARNHRLPI